MDTWSNEQIVVAALGASLLAGLLVAILLTDASITLRRFIGLMVLALTFTTIVWTLGGAVVRLGRAVTFVATCTSDPIKVGNSVRRLKRSDARVLLLSVAFEVVRY
jgi:hypothetical protein